MAFVALEKLHQLYDGYRRVFRIGKQEWILLQEEGGLIALPTSARIYKLRWRWPALKIMYCVALRTGLNLICARACQ